MGKSRPDLGFQSTFWFQMWHDRCLFRFDGWQVTVWGNGHRRWSRYIVKVVSMHACKPFSLFITKLTRWTTLWSRQSLDLIAQSWPQHSFRGCRLKRSKRGRWLDSCVQTLARTSQWIVRLCIRCKWNAFPTCSWFLIASKRACIKRTWASRAIRKSKNYKRWKKKAWEGFCWVPMDSDQLSWKMKYTLIETVFTGGWQRSVHIWATIHTDTNSSQPHDIVFDDQLALFRLLNA